MSLLLSYTTWTFSAFLILVTFKPKVLLQTQGTSTLFHNFSCRFVWFCFSSQCCYIIIHYMNFLWLPHTGDFQNQGITSHREHQHYFTISLAICLILFQFTMSLLLSYNTRTFSAFLILVTFKIKALLQTQGTSTLFHNVSCRFVWFCFSSQCHYYCHIPHELFLPSSYWWPSNPRHYFKHREHQHYFTISLADLFDFVSVHNVATIIIHYMNFLWLPHTGDFQNQGINSNTGNINIISQLFLHICLILFQVTVLLSWYELHEHLVASSYLLPLKSRHHFKHIFLHRFL